MEQQDRPAISRKDEGRLNGGLIGAAFLVVGVLGLTGLGGWHIGQAKRADAAIPDARLAKLTPADLRVDFRAEWTPIETVAKTGKLRRNSTLQAALTDLGADPSDAASALSVLFADDLLDPRRLQAGMNVQASFEPETGRLMAVSLRQQADRSVLAKRLASGDFFAASLGVQMTPAVRRVEAIIDTSIYDAALKAGAADQQVADFASIFAYDIDFQREIHPGDSFEILYETFLDERGNQVQSGNVLYAALNGRALEKGFYRHTPADTDDADYFTREGKSATRFLMRTPINGARLSSSFGPRRHPISGYSRLHKGTDFAAPTGTPIFAAGHGTVERASRYGGYGNYVRIQHANGYETAYAHMSRYGRSIRAGRRVRQGDIIGYVGSTGASTGPHLHYEVLLNGRHVNAMTLRLPTGRTLEGDLLDAFMARRAEIDAIRLANGEAVEVAALEDTGEVLMP